MEWEKDTLIGRLEAGDMYNVKQDVMKVVQAKFNAKLQDKISEYKMAFNAVAKKD